LIRLVFVERVELSGLFNATGADASKPLEVADLPKFRAEVDGFELKLAAQGVDFHALPFTLPEKYTAEELAKGITEFFYKIRDREGPILSLLWSQFCEHWQEQLDLIPLKDAGERIAADFDRGIGAGQKNAYHNRQHTAEVLCCAQVLNLLDQKASKPLDAESHLLLLLAALVHDWHHDGGVNGEEYFRLEKIALKNAKPYLSSLSLLQQQKIDLIIRTTDVGGPHTFARTALAYQRLCARMKDDDDRPPPPPPPQDMEILHSLTNPEHASTVEIAAMLRDADVLPSSGLTADYAAITDTRFHEERALEFKPETYANFLNAVLSRPRTAYDTRPTLPEEKPGMFFAFSSRPAQLFNTNIPDVVKGHARLMEEMGQVPDPDAPPPDENEPTIDLSIFEETKTGAEELGRVSDINLESIAKLRAGLKAAGFLDSPPFTLNVKRTEKIMPKAGPEMLARLNLSDQSADTLQRLHSVSGPVMSALVAHTFDNIGLKVDEPVYKAASAIANEIDMGHGIGTADDNPSGERNPYHNHFHIMDLLLICDLLGQRATGRSAPASSPLARGLLLLGALVCHWHHTGKGNKVDGQYIHFHQQDHALRHATPLLGDMSKELRQSLEILVRSTDPREPYAFSRAAYSFHVGLGPRPEVPPGCEPLARLLGDPALCTLTARLNDAVFVPFVALGPAYSARSMVQLGREIGVPIDFTFLRKNLISPMLGRPPYPGEKPPPGIMLGPQRVASFTCAEAQALFNTSMHALLVAQNKNGSTSAPVRAKAQGVPFAAAALAAAKTTPPPAPEPTPPPAEPDKPTQAPQAVMPAPEEALPAAEPAATPAAQLMVEEVPTVEAPIPLAPEPEQQLEPVEQKEPQLAPEPATALGSEMELTTEDLPEPEVKPDPEPEPEIQVELVAVVVAPVAPPEPEPVAAAQPPKPKADFFGVSEFELDDSELENEAELSSASLKESVFPAPPAKLVLDPLQFPSFRYHTDPVASGVIRPSAEACACCEQVRGFSYYGPVHGINMGEQRVCPWCIADGSAHEKFQITFADPAPLVEAGLAAEIVALVTTRTPGYQSWQRDHWLHHCEDACTFSGDASSAEAQQIAGKVRKQMLDYYDLSEKAWPTFISSYRPGGDPGLYKFVCRHCGVVQYSWDCS
jgi:uncharacterized protein